MNDLYRLENKQVENVFSFDEEVLKKALKNIYGKEFHPMTDIEENLFEATWKTTRGLGHGKPMIRIMTSTAKYVRTTPYLPRSRYTGHKMTWRRCCWTKTAI